MWADPTVGRSIAHSRDSLVRVQRNAMKISKQQGAFRRGFGPASGPTCASANALRRKEKQSLRSSSQHQVYKFLQKTHYENKIHNTKEWCKFPKSWNQEVLDEWGRNSKCLQLVCDGAAMQDMVKLKLMFGLLIN